MTQAVFQELQALVREGEQELGASAGRDSFLDAYRSGMLTGIRTILNMSWEEL